MKHADSKMRLHSAKDIQKIVSLAEQGATTCA